MAKATWSEPVTYTARAVVSGSLGSHVFSNARMAITMRGDTRNVQARQGMYPSGVTACCELENHGYSASISVIENNGRKWSAHFLPGEVFARYDEIRGLVGFGSAVSPYYPITVGCFDPPACSDLGDVEDFSGLTDFAKFDGLATVIADFDFWGPFVGSLDTGIDNFETLSASALLAGATHTCANGVTGNYCSDAAPPALHTDRGDLYLSDLMYADPVTGNVGIFLIEVGNDDTL